MKFLLHLLARLPLHVLQNMGAIAGWLAWLVSARQRRYMNSFMAQANTLPWQRQAIGESGKTILEMPYMWLRDPEQTVRHIRHSTGLDQLERAYQNGRGVLLLAPHLGCWEICALQLAQHFPLTVLYRIPAKAWLARLVKERRKETLHLATADRHGVRLLLRALKKGEVVAMLPDQVPAGGEGVWVPFFGRSAYTMTLAARLADNAGHCFVTWVQRLPYGAGYHSHYVEVEFSPTADIRERATHINTTLEQVIMTCPEQYIWSYNRYRRPPGAPDSPDKGA